MIHSQHIFCIWMPCKCSSKMSTTAVDGGRGAAPFFPGWIQLCRPEKQCNIVLYTRIKSRRWNNWYRHIVNFLLHFLQVFPFALVFLLKSSKNRNGFLCFLDQTFWVVYLTHGIHVISDIYLLNGGDPSPPHFTIPSLRLSRRDSLSNLSCWWKKKSSEAEIGVKKIFFYRITFFLNGNKARYS